jgi:hypothetical protein
MPAKLLKPIGRVLLRTLFRVRVVGGLGPVQPDGLVAKRLLIIANHSRSWTASSSRCSSPPIRCSWCTPTWPRTAGFASGYAWSIFLPWTRRARWRCDRW